MSEDRIIDSVPGRIPGDKEAIDAIDAGQAASLPPLELTLAANAAMEHAHRTTEAAWRATKAHLAALPALAGIGHADAPDRLAQAIGNLRSAGLWPWRWLSTSEVAARLGVTDGRVRQLILAGELDAREASAGVGHVVDDEALDRYLAAHPRRARRHQRRRRPTVAARPAR